LKRRRFNRADLRTNLYKARAEWAAKTELNRKEPIVFPDLK